MVRLLQELQKPVWHLADFVEMSGSEMASGFNTKLKSTSLWYCQPSNIHVDLDSISTSNQES